LKSRRALGDDELTLDKEAALMAKGAIETYVDTVYEHFKIQPTFPPGSLVEVGWIGKVDKGQFVRTSDLRDHGVTFQKRTIDMPAMRFASAEGVDFIASAKGKLSKAVSAIGEADAGLKIAFKKNAAIAIVLDPVTETFIRNVDAITDWLDGPGRRRVDQDHIVVTHVRQAKAGVIAMAQVAGAEVQLKTNVSLGRGPIAIGKVSGKFSLVTTSSTEFVSIPSGRSGLTPFFRVAGYKRDKDIWDHLFGGEGDLEVALRQRLRAKRDLTQEYQDNRVTVAPYDSEMRERIREVVEGRR